MPAPDLSRLRSAEKRQEALQRHHLEQMTGADLTKLPGLDLLAVERILCEIGLDMSRWPSESIFARGSMWLPIIGLAEAKSFQANRERMAIALPQHCAFFIRRIKSRLGAPTAINAGAHKLARLIYRMLKFGKAYVETGQQAYEKIFKERTLRILQRRARQLGFDVTPMASTALVS